MKLVDYLPMLSNMVKKHIPVFKEYHVVKTEASAKAEII